MKIIYCIPSLHNSGGMERVLTVKANYLAEVYGYDVLIVTTSQRGRQLFYSLSSKVKHIDLGIDYESMMSMPLHMRIIARIKAKSLHLNRLSNLLMTERPDITVSMFTHEMSFLPDIADGSKKVLELHFSKQFRRLDALSNKAGIFKRVINKLLDWSDRQQVSKYNCFVVLSHQDADDWRQDVDNVTVISNPASFAPAEKERVDYSTKKVLAIGRLCPQKGFDILIDAWNNIPDKVRKGWTLDIVGSGPNKPMLNAQIKAYGLDNEVHIIPPVKNVRQLYQSHSVFCFPSRYEGFGLSLMEAMSFGLACVASDCPCGSRELIDSRRVGCLTPVESIYETCESLKSLMSSSDLRRRLGEAARKSIQERFSLKLTMDKWNTLFTNLTK